MLEKLDIFRMAYAMASHAGARQAVVAQNIANADTPGYKARDVTSFADMWQNQSDRFDSSGLGAHATRSSHMHGSMDAMQPEIFIRKDATENPNGNAVSLEEEMMSAVDIKRQHEQALAIYRSGLNIIRASIGRA